MRMIMSNKSLIIFRRLLFLFAVTVVYAFIANIEIKAETREVWPQYEATVISGVNVRSVPSTDEGDSTIITMLETGEKVTIIGNPPNDKWYRIKFKRGDVEYGVDDECYAYAKYIEKGTEITPSPTPTPTATPIPTPTQAVATKAPVSGTPTISKAETTDDKGKEETESDSPKSSNSKFDIKIAIYIVLAAGAIFFGTYIVLGLLKQNKRKQRIQNARKVDRIRNDEQQDNGSRKKRPEIRRADDQGYVREVRQSVYFTNAEDDDDMYGIMPRETDDKRTLRAAVDRLQEHDIINHKIYGEGEVYDNSDVKLMEVRFGNDVRFLNKDSIVAKRLIEIIDDEDQATARRRNRRNRNKRNDY